MANRYQVISTHKVYPNWTAERIALHLSCTPSYVRATGQREGLTFPHKRDWMKLPTVEERYEALMASLTPLERATIEEMATERKAIK